MVKNASMPPLAEDEEEEVERFVDRQPIKHKMAEMNIFSEYSIEFLAFSKKKKKIKLALQCNANKQMR